MSNPQTIPSVHKAIAVMRFIADRTTPVSVKELAYSLNIPQVSCYRIVRTLLEHNWIQEEASGGFRVAFGLAHLARSYSEIEHALHTIETPLRQLSSQLSLSAKITLREGHYVTTALRVEPSRPNAITSPVGYRFHIGIGSAGSALLSTLGDEEIRRIIATAPAEVRERQRETDIWQRVQECRQSGICKEMGLQHPFICAISGLLRLTPSVACAVTLVGWPEEFAGKRTAQVAKELRHSIDAMQQLLGTVAE
ncbi:helix-turn-helix domain-containing protein [Ruficoccus amylovorans]|uniref:Helix-turn-helix domain-containing protein n=1 Tax=Ruficoccus amylovorans TaxID=1804625 RepID=A0A842HF26_9BACT|nr:helix-turn-helix domain-containing protein [Ruficoccus amylovorans]MBC2594648.1 helix-turn-helix domain-containing protein [Ruficoccus amylovorans]